MSFKSVKWGCRLKFHQYGVIHEFSKIMGVHEVSSIEHGEDGSLNLDIYQNIRGEMPITNFYVISYSNFIVFFLSRYFPNSGRMR